MRYFNTIGKLPFSQQAVSFLNAFWPEVKGEAEFIYSVTWEVIKGADMHAKGIQLVHKYQEGIELSFDITLYFYEKLCNFTEDPKNAKWKSGYPTSIPTMMTAIQRKAELSTIDVNSDNNIALIEVLLHQYSSHCNPAEFCRRSMTQEEHPEIIKARQALDAVNTAIQKYEEEKAKYAEAATKDNVAGKAAKNMLAQLDSSPIGEKLNESLINAEKDVRKAVAKYGGAKGESGPTAGSIWWLERDLAEKQARYGPKSRKQ